MEFLKQHIQSQLAKSSWTKCLNRMRQPGIESSMELPSFRTIHCDWSPADPMFPNVNVEESTEHDWDFGYFLSNDFIDCRFRHRPPESMSLIGIGNPHAFHFIAGSSHTTNSQSSTTPNTSLHIPAYDFGKPFSQRLRNLWPIMEILWPSSKSHTRRLAKAPDRLP